MLAAGRSISKTIRFLTFDFAARGRPPKNNLFLTSRFRPNTALAKKQSKTFKNNMCFIKTIRFWTFGFAAPGRPTENNQILTFGRSSGGGRAEKTIWFGRSGPMEEDWDPWQNDWDPWRNDWDPWRNDWDPLARRTPTRPPTQQPVE